jgi:RNA polymerase primary sigma factor
MPPVRERVSPAPRSLHRSAPANAFDQYLLDIRKLPMIENAKEEIRLAKRARKGDQAAVDRLVTANLRFVISYVKRFQGHGLDLSELVAIGNEGLLKAVRKFDPAHGVKFISYAVWWVRQCVLKALAEQTRTVRIPLNQNAALMKMARIESLLAQELGRSPTDSETAQVLDEDVETIRQARLVSTVEVSLDAPVERHDSGSATFGERVAGNTGDIENLVDAGLRKDFLSSLFRRYLTAREQRILSLYYGLEEGSEPLTLEGIGAMLGVTRERVRQIRERAFEKLRNAPEVKHLKSLPMEAA